MMKFASVICLILFCLAPALRNASAQQPPAGPTETYKGVKLIGTGYPNRKNKKFFRNIKIAIDMVRKLPKAEWNQTANIKTILYNPPHPDRVAPGITANIVGVYTIGDYQRWPAPMIVYQNMLYSSGLKLALSIVGNGIHARSHRTLAANIRLISEMEAGRIPMDKSKLNKARQARDYEISLIRKEAPPEVLFKENCTPRIAVLNAHKILHNDRYKLDLMHRDLVDEGCL